MNQQWYLFLVMPWNEEWTCIIIPCRFAEKREDLKVVFGKPWNGSRRVILFLFKDMYICSGDGRAQEAEEGGMNKNNVFSLVFSG